MTGTVRVLVHCRAPEDGGEDAVMSAYHAISERLAGTPGLLGNQLMRSVLAPGEFTVISEWAGMTEFLAWEQGPDHRDATAPLRPYQDHSRGRSFGVYEVVGAH